MNASTGSAALAALFDHHDLAEEEQIIEGKCEPVSNARALVAIDQQLEDALGAGPIARLIEQQKSSGGSASPFHDELSLLQQHNPALESLLKDTARPGSGMRDEPPRGLLSKMAAGLIRVISQIGAFFDQHILERFSGRSRSEGLVITPGDIKVSEWRQQQRRKARNKLTPLRLLGWTLWANACVAVGAGPVIWRENIIAVWPETSGLYAYAGLAEGIMPVDVINTDYRYALSDQGAVVELTGALQHNGEAPVRTPLVRATVRNSQGETLTSWVFRPAGPRQMVPQMELPFMTRSLAPEGTTTLSVSIVPEKERVQIEQAAVDPLLDGEENGQSFYLQRTTSGWSGSGEILTPQTQER
ncbi:MAG: hypothetical protein MRY72_07955 [Aquisalinus sp.]|nr:hypothetical protein [Aquisalinus sp.]